MTNPPDPSVRQSVVIILVCVLGFIISNMSQLAINVMSPSIQDDLDIDSTNIQLISTSFSLAYGGTLLLAGRLSDIYGHKFCLLIGLTIFSGFSLASAMANSALQLTIFRAMQGLGASVISPALLGILARTFAQGSKLRTEGFAAFSTGSPLGASIGLLVGDGIASTTRPGWRSFFYFCLALSGLVIMLSHFILPPDPPRDLQKSAKDVDWFGAALLMSGLVVLVASLLFLPRYGWKSPYMLVPLCLGLVLIAAFLSWETYVDRRGKSKPLVPFSLFRRPYFLALQVIAGLVYLAFTNHNYFMNYYFQSYLKISLLQNLIRFAPLLVVGLALNLVTGHLANLLPAQLIILVGCVASLTSCVLSAYMNPDGSYWQSNFAAIVLSVIGADFVFSIVAMFGSRISRSDEQGVAGAVLLSFTRIFSVIGLGFATIAQGQLTVSTGKSLGVTITKTSISKAPPEAYWQGLKAAFTVFLGSALIATLMSATTLWLMGYVGAHIKEPIIEPFQDIKLQCEEEVHMTMKIDLSGQYVEKTHKVEKERHDSFF